MQKIFLLSLLFISVTHCEVVPNEQTKRIERLEQIYLAAPNPALLAEIDEMKAAQARGESYRFSWPKFLEYAGAFVVTVAGSVTATNKVRDGRRKKRGEVV